MTKLEWDKSGSRYYETGTKNGVLYPQDDTGAYKTGVAWNGLTAVTETPGGAEATDLYADDMKYASIRSAETFNATIEAYTYPDEFGECDGSYEIATGVSIGQQPRKSFGFSYKTTIGNDTGAEAYKLHLIYGLTASPSEKGYSTINDSPDAITFSWEVESTPINVPEFKPTSIIVIDSRKADKDNLAEIEKHLYGDNTTEPTLLLPEDIKKIIEGTYVAG